MKDVVRLVRMFDDEDFSPNKIVYLIYLIPFLSSTIILSELIQSNFIEKVKSSFKISIFLYPILFLLTIYLNSKNTNFNKIVDFIGYGFWLTLAASCYLLYDVLSGKSRTSLSDTEIISQSSFLNNESEENESIVNGFANEKENVSNSKVQNAEFEKLIQAEEEIAIGYQLIEEQEKSRRLNKRVIFVFTILALIFTLGGIWFFTKGTNNASSTKDTELPSITEDSSNEISKGYIPPNNNPFKDNQIQRTERQIQSTYIIISEKAHFFNQPDPLTMRKGYLIKDNQIEIEKINGEFAYGAFTDAAGKVTRGWLLLKDIDKLTHYNIINTFDTLMPMPEEVLTKDNISYSFFSLKPFSDLKNIFKVYCSDDSYIEDNNSLSGYGKQERCYFIKIENMGNKCKVDYSWECDRSGL